VSPYLCVHDAAAAIEFYKKVFHAEELMRLADPSGKVGHAEIKIGAGVVMLADEQPEMGILSPKTLGAKGRPPLIVHLYLDDVDAAYRRALAAGAASLRPLEDQFYGDRTAQIADPFGHVWYLATHKEDVSPEEIDRRFRAMTHQQS
jgi:PhnB protein